MIELRHSRVIEIFWQTKYDVRAVGTNATRTKRIFTDLHPVLSTGTVLTQDQYRVLMAYGALSRDIETPVAFTGLSKTLNMSQTEVRDAFNGAITALAMSPDVATVMALHGVYKEQGRYSGPQLKVPDTVLHFELPTLTPQQRV